LFGVDEGVYPPNRIGESLSKYQGMEERVGKRVRGCPGSPLRASTVKDETLRSGGTKHEGMKKVVREIVQTRTLSR